MTLQQIDKFTLYSKRLLVFLEEEAQSNKYRQVHLNAEEFKKISDIVCGSEAKEGEEEVEVTMSLDMYDLPDLREINKMD